MDMEKPRNNKVALQMNHFDNLPDELLISIINKIDDFKSLCRCTIVSKRFASKIYHIQSVTVRLPGIDMDSIAADSDPCRHFSEIEDDGEQEVMQLIERPSVQRKLRFLPFLANFTQLESVNLEFDCPRTPCTASLLKWTLKFFQSGATDSGAMVEGLVSLLPTSISKETDREEDEEEEDEEEEHDHGDVFYFLKSHGGENSLLFALVCCCEWLVVVTTLIKRHHSIRNVTCMDKEGHGKFALGGERLSEWRRRLLSDQRSYDTNPRTVYIGWVRDLQLPVSGIRMKGVFCVFMDFRMELNLAFSEVEQDFLKSLEYDDEEKEMGEAVKEIVDKHWNSVKWGFNTLY